MLVYIRLITGKTYAVDIGEQYVYYGHQLIENISEATCIGINCIKIILCGSIIHYNDVIDQHDLCTICCIHVVKKV